MFYLTGYDTFGFSLFQCMILDANGDTHLLTRLPDLRQARYTSDIPEQQIHIWSDAAGSDPVGELKALLARLGLAGAKLGIELDSYGLKAAAWRSLEQVLAGFCTWYDASTLIDTLRARKSDAELAYVRRAADLPRCWCVTRGSVDISILTIK